MQFTRECEATARLLCEPKFNAAVDLVCFPTGQNQYAVVSPQGRTEFRRVSTDEGPRFETLTTERVDPLGSQDPAALLGSLAEQAAPFPTGDLNSFPFAQEQISQFFDAPHAPDLLIQHSAAHFVDSNLGQHGSLGIIQARAPFIARGPGIAPQGLRSGFVRMVDVAPTILEALLIPERPAHEHPTHENPHLESPAHESPATLLGQDGSARTDLIAASTATRVLVLLLDGCNANALYSAASQGLAPNIASLIDEGFALTEGALASLPTATLANHMTANTGAHPGHHGVLHHTWFDRQQSTTPDLLEMSQMFSASDHLSQQVETLHEAIHRLYPGAITTAAMEFCDRGADHSSFAQFRNETSPPLPSLEECNTAFPELANTCAPFGFMSCVDEAATQQTIEWWHAHLPTFSWCSFSLTDEVGHIAGPYGEMTSAAITDSDRRVGDLLRALEQTGTAAETLVVLLSDHGMEQCDPMVQEDLAEALTTTGIPHRLVGGQFVYFE